MKGKNYTKEFKESVLNEVRETNNVAQVARRHELSTKTIYAWRKQASTRAWDVTDGTAKKIASILRPTKNLSRLNEKTTS